MTVHGETPIKVTAWVGKGVAELVLALNAIPGVITLDSCQETPAGTASVTFRTYRYHDLPSLYRKMHAGLSTVIPGLTLTSEIRCPRCGAATEDSPPAAVISCPPEMVPIAAWAVTAWAAANYAPPAARATQTIST